MILFVGLTTTTVLFWFAHRQWQGEPISPIKAFFAVINMIFFQLTFADMPSDQRLDIFPVIVPLFGLPLFSLFGLKMIHIIRVFFVRAERGQDWQEAVVKSAVKSHVVICGLGRIGYRVAKILAFDYGMPLVAINDRQTPLVEELIALGVPVILGDTEHADVLKKAGIELATVVVVCTDKDLVNLGTTVLIRKLNPSARILLRMFEDELMDDIQAKFSLDAVISRSAVAALTFTYAAIGAEIIETFELADRDYVLAQVVLESNSPMVGRTISEVADERDVTVVCHTRGPTLTVEPDPDLGLLAGDNLFIFTTVERMMALIEYGVKYDPVLASRRKGPIWVCGLGHTGYRIVTNLRNLGCEVLGLDFEPGRMSQRLAELGIPLKFGDLRWNSLLIEAGLEQATTIVACTDDDMTNMQIALRARTLNPDIRIVMRIFDDQLSERLQQAFGTNAVYSTSALASPNFVSAALNRKHVRLVDVGGIPQAIARLQINLSALDGLSVADLQREENLTVLLHARNGQVTIPPQGETCLSVGDEVLVLTTEKKLIDLNRRNEPT
jgi:Trk K+ transport system NAD-binding subunit